MRSRTDRDRDRASFSTSDYEKQPMVMLAYAICEFCRTLDDFGDVLLETAAKKPGRVGVDAHDRDAGTAAAGRGPPLKSARGGWHDEESEDYDIGED